MIHRLDMTRFDLAGLIDVLHLKTGVEIGVLNGYFSYHLLKQSQLKTLWGVDSYQGKAAHYAPEGSAHLEEFGERSRLLRMSSVKAAELAAEEEVLFDFVYIDASHDEASVRADIEAWFPRTARPCVFAGHDYLHLRNYGVVQVVNDLARRCGCPIYVTKERLASWFFILGTDCQPGLTLPQQRERELARQREVKWNTAFNWYPDGSPAKKKITLVNALWGDVLVRAYPKVLNDVQDVVSLSDNCRGMPSSFPRMVFAYGVANFNFLKAYGFKPIQLSHHPLVDFQGVGDRTHEGRGQMGETNFGYSLWQHKTHAIRQAFERGAEAVIWLDWDTRICNLDMQVIELLHEGPEFQGRIRRYLHVQPGTGTKDVYHGGCYYARSPRVFEEIDRLTPQMPHTTDEARAMLAVQNLFFGGQKVPVETHREFGFDNPRFYESRGNAVPSSERPVFHEGGKKAAPTFVMPLKSPPPTFFVYDVSSDNAAPLANVRE